MGDAAGADEADPELVHACSFSSGWGRPQHRAVERRGLRGHARGGEVPARSAAARPRAAAAAGSASAAASASARRVGVARRGEEGMVAAERLDHARDPRRDDRQAERHRLEHDERQALEARRQHQQVGGGHQVADVVARGRGSGSLGPAAACCLAGGPLGALADQQQPGRRPRASQRPHSADQRALVLLRREPADGEEERRSVGQMPSAARVSAAASGRRAAARCRSGSPRAARRGGRRASAGAQVAAAASDTATKASTRAAAAA